MEILYLQVFTWKVLSYSILGEKFAPGLGSEPRSSALRAGALPFELSGHIPQTSHKSFSLYSLQDLHAKHLHNITKADNLILIHMRVV